MSTERFAESGGREYRLMLLPDFKRFRELVFSSGKEWTTHYSDKISTVQSKPPPDNSTNLNIIRARRVMEKVPPRVLYDQLHDPDYRTTWDANMIEGTNTVKLDPHNDIGYYSAKFPWPLTNRDFCNQRSWMEFLGEEYVIFNHSEPHSSCPEKKGFIRARSILSGYFIRPHASGGCELFFVTHSDPCGMIPHAIINFTMSKAAPQVLSKCEKCSMEYPAWAAKHYPPGHVYPWTTPKMYWDSPLMYPEDMIEATTYLNPQKHLTEEDLEEQAIPSPSKENGESFGELKKEKNTTIVSYAPVAPLKDSDVLAIQQYRTTMQDALNAVDRSFLMEGRKPSTREYLVRLQFMLEGISETL
ncbi:hypothetical protein AGDE_11362 [Angomonas deanei]|nr:hypothetical protein AGDE_11362 [Angomonas deanei]|eukprot:EPY26400.1 hypothetical protein AGDE_11362 [Angomonas deanei]